MQLLPKSVTGKYFGPCWLNLAGNLATDTHLAALAIENGAELCSTDSDFARFPRLHWTNPLR